MKAITLDELRQFLETIASEYDVRVPIRLHDGTRALGSLGEGPLAIDGGKLPGKPTCVFFPQSETIFTADENGNIVGAQPKENPIFVLGMTAQDLDCLEFIDKFFSTEFRDDIYFNKRDRSVVVGVSGKCGHNGELMKIAGGKCDLELISDGKLYIVTPYSDQGKELEKNIRCRIEDASLDALQKESDGLPNDDLDILKKASELMKNEKVPDAFWEEIADRCIACGTCNYVCPTCTCFEVYDRRCSGRIERRRMWDSCQFDGFMRETSGHNPMGTEITRTRRRIHHKLVADVERWGHITCFLCGRCGDACPTEIGIKAVCREIISRFS